MSRCEAEAVEKYRLLRTEKTSLSQSKRYAADGKNRI